MASPNFIASGEVLLNLKRLSIYSNAKGGFCDCTFIIFQIVTLRVTINSALDTSIR